MRREWVVVTKALRADSRSCRSGDLSYDRGLELDLDEDLLL